MIHSREIEISEYDLQWLKDHMIDYLITTRKSFAKRFAELDPETHEQMVTSFLAQMFICHCGAIGVPKVGMLQMITEYVEEFSIKIGFKKNEKSKN